MGKTQSKYTKVPDQPLLSSLLDNFPCRCYNLVVASLERLDINTFVLFIHDGRAASLQNAVKNLESLQMFRNTETDPDVVSWRGLLSNNKTFVLTLVEIVTKGEWPSNVLARGIIHTEDELTRECILHTEPIFHHPMCGHGVPKNKKKKKTRSKKKTNLGNKK